MNRNAQRIGFLSAWGIIILTTIYLILLTLPLLIKQESEWIPSITSYYRIETSGGFLSDFEGSVFYLRNLLMILLFAAFIYYVRNPGKIFAVTALCFIIISSVLHTLSYIGQFSLRNININTCDNECLLFYIHSFLNKYLTSVNVIALTVFVGLAQLFLIPAFTQTNKTGEKMSLTLIITSIFNLLSALMCIMGKEGISAFFMLCGLILFMIFLILSLKFSGQFKSQEYDG